MYCSKISIVLLVVLIVHVTSNDSFVYTLNGITYGSNATSCYKKCKRGQICTVRGAVTTCKAYCGDGIVVGTELLPRGCDDGNQNTTDGCNRCVTQSLWSCSFLNSDVPSACQATCGNGILQTITGEQCDDGNRRNGDGCTPKCQLIPRWNCNPVQGQLSRCTPICGDGVKIGDQQCDDKNNLDGDGCSSTCTVQNTCSGQSSTCQNKCGNKVLDVDQGENCDNGFSTTDDGCSNDCQTITDGWYCLNAPGKTSSCSPLCGDGRLIGSENDPGRCDDGNLIPSDGCSTNCFVNIGYTCTGTPSVCTPICGDGLVIGTQKKANYCDDSNINLGDGCENCQITRNFICIDFPSICVYLCGNKRWNAAAHQDCDNGYSTQDDGCSNDCQVNPGWKCRIAGQFAFSVCTPVCGDGIIIAGKEGCDDGNTNDGDGCSATCTVQPNYDCSSTNADGSSNCISN